MISIIPPQFRIAAVIAALLVVASLSGTAGWTAATWKAEASCSASKEVLYKQIVELDKEIAVLKENANTLKNAITSANHQVELMKAHSDAIEAVQREAVKIAALKEKSSQERLERMKAQYASATSCGDVLDTYWNERK